MVRTNDPWVGTWRPHKPRGPIAALYGSPGPKYALPGLTGHANHDSTKYKAPMYSFGTSHDKISTSISPGPIYQIPSNITRTGRDGTPAFSLHSKTGSFLQDPKKTPGPAAYRAVDPCIYSQRPPQYSMTGRNFATGETTKTPGPGAYNPERVTCTTPKTPSFSFGLRHSEYILPVIVNVPKTSHK